MSSTTFTLCSFEICRWMKFERTLIKVSKQTATPFSSIVKELHRLFRSFNKQAITCALELLYFTVYILIYAHATTYIHKYISKLNCNIEAIILKILFVRLALIDQLSRICAQADSVLRFFPFTKRNVQDLLYFTKYSEKDIICA